MDHWNDQLSVQKCHIIIQDLMNILINLNNDEQSKLDCNIQRELHYIYLECEI